MNGRKLIPGRQLPASEIPDYDIRRDTLEETLSTAFLERLETLNRFVLASGETPVHATTAVNGAFACKRRLSW